MLNGKIHHNKESPEEKCPLIRAKGSHEYIHTHILKGVAMSCGWGGGDIIQRTFQAAD